MALVALVVGRMAGQVVMVALVIGRVAVALVAVEINFVGESSQLAQTS